MKFMFKKKYYRIVLFAVLLILGNQSNILSQVKTFTLEEAIKSAVAQNKEAAVADMNVQKAEAAVHEAFGNALPSLNLEGSYSNYLKKPIMVINQTIKGTNGAKDSSLTMIFQLGGSNNYEAKATLTQILFNSAVFEGIGSSKKYLDLAKESYNSTVTKTVSDVKKAFFGVVYTKNAKEIAKQSYENAQKNFENIKALHGEGFVSDFDLLQAEVYVTNVKPSLLSSETGYKTALDGLKITMGINQTEQIDVNGELLYQSDSEQKAEELITKAKSDNYNLKTLNMKREVDEAFINLYKSEYWPSLVAFGNYSFAGTSETFKFYDYQSSMVGLSLSINLFNGMKSNYRVQQAQISAQQTGEQYKQLSDAIEMQIKTKLSEIANVKAMIEAQEMNVEKAQRAYDIALIRFQEGEGSQIEIQNNDMALSLSKLNRLQSYYQYNVAKSDLDYLIGSIKEEYLKRRNN
jgi:outer membrane protein TolC